MPAFKQSPSMVRRVRRADLRRRGGVYVLVLGVATMIAVVGLGAIAITRSEIKSTRAASDWTRAEALAESGVEAVIATMNTSTTWRADIASGAKVSIGAMGGGQAAYKVVDTTDGNLSKGDQDSVTVYGFGQVGEATRAFSLDCQYRPPPVLDVLKYAVYANGSISCPSAMSVSGAPLGSASLTNGGTLTANVRVGSLTNNGTIIGEVRTGETALASLSDGSLSSLSGRAVLISYGSLASGGEIRDNVLSAGVNPYGSISTSGIYRIVVPLGSRLRIRNCRICATLIIELGLLSQLDVREAVNWDRPSGDLPTLVLVTAATSTVSLTGTTSALSEATQGVNFNPASTPYIGASDTDKTDTYPSEIRGVIHMSGLLSSITVGPTLKIVGTVISETGLTFSTGVQISYDPQVLRNPPTAYRTGVAGMDPVAGSWKWQVLP